MSVYDSARRTDQRLMRRGERRRADLGEFGSVRQRRRLDTIFSRFSATDQFVDSTLRSRFDVSKVLLIVHHDFIRRFGSSGRRHSKLDGEIDDRSRRNDLFSHNFAQSIVSVVSVRIGDIVN